MKSNKVSRLQIITVQVIVCVALVASWAGGSPIGHDRVLSELGTKRFVPKVAIPRQTPLIIEPLYDDPNVVSDEELGAVLTKIRPKFPKEKLKSNFVEHAIRAWWINAKFQDPKVMSGEALKDHLVDHGQHLASWSEYFKSKDKVFEPILQGNPDGVAIRWSGKEECASVHHDHWLACLTEAGVDLHEPVFMPNGRRQIEDVLQEAMRDFRLDEVEVEWSALAFGLWIAPQKSWTTRSGREITFDLLADRLMRGHKRFGVCSGTHRLYSLMVLVRLDDNHDILSDAVRARIMGHLANVRDLIVSCQFEDGHWPSNWPEGEDALTKPIEDELYKKVIATGHHIEWLAIAPEELHPPREVVIKAADWLIKTTTEMPDAELLGKYTFFSHVGNALALWRKTHPSDFWAKWEPNHPIVEELAPPPTDDKAEKSDKAGPAGH